MLEFQPNFKRTRSNRFIIKDINIEDFLKYFNSLDNTTPEMESTLKEILIGKLKKAEVETLPEFKTVCEYIEKYISLTKSKESFLINSTSSESKSKMFLFDEVKNDSNEFDEDDYDYDEYEDDSTLIVDKLLDILKNNIKIKKKDRKKLYKLWINRSDNRENLNSILSILNSIIAKNI